MKIGIIGTGYFSRFHAEILARMKAVKITAICGTSLEKATAMAEQYKTAEAYDQVESMLESEQLDAVYICVPPMQHGEIEQHLIEKKIPFLVEKPLSHELEVPRKIVESVRENELITSVGYHFRYSESIERLKEEVNRQKIGIVLGQYMGSMPQVSWWRDQARSGGQFLEQTTHIVDLLRYICGDIEEVQALYGQTSFAQGDASITVADVGTVTLKLQEGLVANISNTCILPASMGRIGLTFYTESGILDWTPGHLKIRTVDGETEVVDELNPYEKESQAFIHAVGTGDCSGILSDYEDAWKTHQVTYAALKSARENRIVSIEEA